ncbi:hypothetical protein CDAR_209871 [Caerostris darwini]|uniref:Uncharacterized protein n=1 Tax=Caerostris darwini TaxID=1538125 RepID=A0AAV4NE59_9ARAC|nr:hypothetical protein CDAR_209871 [Caerostris darwini]
MFSEVMDMAKFDRVKRKWKLINIIPIVKHGGGHGWGDMVWLWFGGHGLGVNADCWWRDDQNVSCNHHDLDAFSE